MDFIKLDNGSIYCEDVYNILKLCGEDMYKNNGLKHWLNPYPLECIKNDIENKNVYILKDAGGCVATFSLSNKPSNYFNNNEKFIYLSKFAVHPNHGRKGLGEICLKYIEDLCRYEGNKGIRLDVYDKSYPAVQFYLKNKFVELYKAKTKNFQVICMEKRVK